jgi:hypothetical protein
MPGRLANKQALAARLQVPRLQAEAQVDLAYPHLRQVKVVTVLMIVS